MSLELVVTSAPRGLKPNSSGFCTVAATAGMAKQVMMKLEALSGYEFRFNLSDPNASLNPTNCAYTQIKTGSEITHVLSRVAFCGADYSGRTNKIAHHFVLSPNERLANGPAWMLRQMASSGVFASSWDDSPGEKSPRSLKMLEAVQASHRSGPARQWEQVTGDAGWGGMLAKAFHDNTNTPAFVIFEPGVDLLPLFEESLALLPGHEKWAVSFATYYTTMPTGCHYHWRGVLAGSTAAREIARFPNATVIDLRKRPLGKADDSPYANAARMGAIVEPHREEAVPGKKRKKPLKKPEIPAFFGFDAEKVRVPSAPDAAAPSERPAFAGSDFADSDAKRRLRKNYRRANMFAAGLALFAAALLVGNLVTCRKLSAERTEKNSAQRELASARGELKRAKSKIARLDGDKEVLEISNAALTKRLKSTKPRSKTPPKPRTPLRIKREVLPTGTVGESYLKILRVENRSAQLKWTKLDGSLPDALKLRQDGRITGVAREAGSFTFTVQVASTRANDNTSPGKEDFTIRVEKAAASSQVVKPEPTGKPVELIDFAKIDLGNNKVKREPATIEKEQEGKSIQFKLPAFEAIVDRPEQLKKDILACRRDLKRTSVAVRYRSRGLGNKVLFECSCDRQQGRLVWQIDEGVAKGYPAWLNYFVLLAADRASKPGAVYHCMRPRPRLEGKITVAYDEDGKLKPLDKASEWSFAYPWPDALKVQHPALDDAKPVWLSELMKRRQNSIVIRRTLPKHRVRVMREVMEDREKEVGRGKHKKTIKVKVKVRKKVWEDVNDAKLGIKVGFNRAKAADKKTGAKEVKVLLSFAPCATTIPEPERFYRALAAELKAAQDRKRDHEKKLSDLKEEVSRLERQLAADRKRKIAPPFLKRQQDHIAAVRKSQNGPRQDIGNVGKEIRKIQARITESRPAPQERFKGAAGVRILDAWGLPVATVTPHVVLVRKKAKK